MEFDKGWNFNFSCYAAAYIVSEFWCVSNSEAVRWLYCDLELFSIKFLHSLNFSKSDGISIRKSMFLFIMKVNQTGLIFRNASNVDRLFLLTRCIENFMFFPEIHKSKPIEPKISTINKSDILFSASFIQLN